MIRCRRIDESAAALSVLGQLDTLVRLVVDEAAICEPLDGRGHGSRRQTEAFGQHTGVGVAVTRKAINRLQCLAIGLG